MDSRDVREVTVTGDDGSCFRFFRDQKRDRHDVDRSSSKPVREAPETVKVEAQELRDRIKKAGLLP